MDLLRSCYKTRMRFWVGSNRSVPVRWFFCKEDAKIFPTYHRFASLNWEGKPWRDTGLGEVISEPRPYDKGGRPFFQVGQRFCGDPAWYAEGLDPNYPYKVEWVDRYGIPACCFASGRGGVVGWGRAETATRENGRIFYGERALVAGSRPALVNWPNDPQYGPAPLVAAGAHQVASYAPPDAVSRGGLVTDGASVQEYQAPYLVTAGLLSAGLVRTSYSGAYAFPVNLIAGGFARVRSQDTPEVIAPLLLAARHVLAKLGETAGGGLVVDGHLGIVPQYQGPRAGLVTDGTAVVQHENVHKGKAPALVDGTVEGLYTYQGPEDPAPITVGVRGMVAIWSDAGEKRGLEWMLMLRNGLFMYLFQNDFVPNDNMQLSDLVEANFTGYARYLMAFPSQTLGGPPVATITASPCSFQCDPLSVPTGNQIYGYYVVEQAFGRLMYAERFVNAPLAMNAPAAIIVVVSTPTLRSEF